MAKMVNTVLGPVEAKDLGKTLVHEHLQFMFAGYQGDTTIGPYRQLEAFKACMQWCKPLTREYGFKTIIDATPNECGRDPEFLALVAEALDMNIICSTGYYFEPASAYMYWQYMSSFMDVEDAIYDFMKKEVTDGIEDTGIRAGVIKLASSQGQITPYEQKFFRAGARVSAEFGTPIITHTQLGTCGPEQAKLLIENGADPQNIQIGHMCGNMDLDYHKRVLDQGVFDSFDRFGLEGELYQTPTDAQRCDVIMALIREGYEDQIVMSHDTACFMMGRKYEVSESTAESLANSNVLNIPRRVIPMLKERGISDTQLHKIFVDNPARLLG